MGIRDEVVADNLLPLRGHEAAEPVAAVVETPAWEASLNKAVKEAAVISTAADSCLVVLN